MESINHIGFTKFGRNMNIYNQKPAYGNERKVDTARQNRARNRASKFFFPSPTESAISRLSKIVLVEANNQILHTRHEQPICKPIPFSILSHTSLSTSLYFVVEWGQSADTN